MKVLFIIIKISHDDCKNILNIKIYHMIIQRFKMNSKYNKLRQLKFDLFR